MSISRVALDLESLANMYLLTKLKRAVGPLYRQLTWRRRCKPEGVEGVRKLGHRGYVGKQWDEPGVRQFEFMKRRGLTEDSVLLDLGCGSLRGGVHFIPFLKPGHYLGIDKESSLIAAGTEKELGHGQLIERRPELVVSDAFEFERFSKVADLAVSISLFSHLNRRDARCALTRLAAWAGSGLRLYATFFVAEDGPKRRNPPASHAHATFRYTEEEIRTFGAAAGFSVRHCEAWHDPLANQKMFEFVLDRGR
jgi:SAM-dependent methyltransferase